METEYGNYEECKFQLGKTIKLKRRMTFCDL